MLAISPAGGETLGVAMKLEQNLKMFEVLKWILDPNFILEYGCAIKKLPLFIKDDHPAVEEKGVSATIMKWNIG